MIAARFPLPLPPRVKGRIALGFAAALAAGVGGLVLLALSGWFLTAAALAGASGAGAIAAFNYLIPAAAIRGLAVVRTAARYGERLWSHEAALHALAGLRGILFARLAHADARSAPDLSGGDASARLIGDIAALEDLVVRRPGIPAAFGTMLVGLAAVALAGWLAALLHVAALALLLAALARLPVRLSAAPAAEAAAATAGLRRMLVDYAAARSEIITYGLADRVTAQLVAQADRLDEAQRQLARIEAASSGLLILGSAVAAGATLLVSTASAPITALAMLAATASIEAVAAIARSSAREAAVTEGTERLRVLLALPVPQGKDTPAAAAALPIGLGQALFAPASRIALTGPSGSGKTRVIEALAGLRAPAHGLSLGDQGLAALSETAIRAQIALAPQEPMLIAGSVADNLRLARPGIDAPAMELALRTAQLWDRIMRMPQGLDSVLGEDGGILSGGERKRLALARALLAERPWLLLDEPTEGLDAATEAALVTALGTWLDATGTGLLIASHRPAPLALAGLQVPVEAIPAT
ncbi:ATP-binding cassette domain-containing protein [Novosphingobium sp. NDB2Meth1]|uniref:ATP-binding cassette domain-containing protein n=1 Tax=Novosphingobium sp. NDB2Meth1 TaxID=1892847 RepID=UPI0009300CD2|nr:ATP-binding cassette domain-containing protein [Novosphingobium sp. NDB2Meth1]